METRTEIRLTDDDWARKTAVKRALASVRIVLKRPEDRMTEEDRKGLAALRALVRSDWLSADRLAAARDVLARLLRECAEQGDESWWAGHGVGPDVTDATGKPMAPMLAEARRQQAAEARNALAALAAVEAEAGW